MHFLFPGAAQGALLLVMSLVMSGAAPSALPPHPDAHAAAASPGLPIRSHIELAAWRRVHPGPLDRMSPTGLARFLRGLELTARGPVRFPLADLRAELTDTEVTAVARLFGLDGQWEGLTEEEARRVRLVDRPRVATPLERQVEAFEAALETLEASAMPARRAAGARAMFEQAFPPAGWAQQLAIASDHELLLLWRAASSAAFHARDPRLDRRASDTLAVLRERGLDTRLQVRELQAIHLAAGNPEEARAVAMAMPERNPIRLPPLQPLHDGPPRHTAWDVSGDPPVLVERKHAASGRRIVVVSAVGCGFSRAATAGIAGDAVLGPAFERHALWLASPRELANWEALRRWNDAHPRSPIQVATREAAWPGLSFDQTPVFVLMEDDAILSTVHGWTPDSRMRLEHALRMHDFLAE